MKNYDNKKKYKIHRDLTPVQSRKSSNFNLNVNTKSILFRDFDHSNNKKSKRPKLKLKKTFCDNLNNINSNFGFRTGKKFFGIHKNNETLKGYLKTKPFDIKKFVSNNPSYFKYERNKTPDNIFRINQKSFILMNSYEPNYLWEEAKFRKLNELNIKTKKVNDCQNKLKRANSVNYSKINKKISYKENEIISDKIKIRKISPFNKKNHKISKSFNFHFKEI